MTIFCMSWVDPWKKQANVLPHVSQTRVCVPDSSYVSLLGLLGKNADSPQVSYISGGRAKMPMILRGFPGDSYVSFWG